MYNFFCIRDEFDYRFFNSVNRLFFLQVGVKNNRKKNRFIST